MLPALGFPLAQAGVEADFQAVDLADQSEAELDSTPRGIDPSSRCLKELPWLSTSQGIGLPLIG